MKKIKSKIEFILAILVLLIGLANCFYSIFTADQIKNLIKIQSLFYVGEVLLGIGLIIDSFRKKN
jgi:hypothetical protein